MNAHVKPAAAIAAPATASPLTGFIAELARLERQRRRLDQAAVVERLEARLEGPTAVDLRAQLREREAALMTLASHHQAATAAEAALQALIAFHADLPALAEDLPADFRASAAGGRFQAAMARAERLLFSIAHAAADVGEDLALLRDVMAPRGFQGLGLTDEMGDGLAQAA